MDEHFATGCGGMYVHPHGGTHRAAPVLDISAAHHHRYLVAQDVHPVHPALLCSSHSLAWSQALDSISVAHRLCHSRILPTMDPDDF